MARHVSFDVRRSSPFVFPCALGVCALVAGMSGIVHATPPAVEAPARLNRRPCSRRAGRAYPVEAQGVKGDVAVTATITPAGDVSGVELTTGVAPALDRAALKAAMSWRFRPALRDGAPIASRVQLLFHFEPPAALPEAQAPPAPQPPASPATPQSAPLPVCRSALHADGCAGSSRRPRAGERTGDARRHRARAPAAAEPGRLRFPDPSRRSGGDPARQRRRPPQAGARDPADQRGGRGARRADLHARLRRRRRPGRRDDRGRCPYQRGGQPARQRLRRHALHHPRAGRVAARPRRPVRSAAGELRGRRQRRLPARVAAAGPHRQLHRGELGDRTGVGALGTAGREHPHLRRGGDLQDQRLRPEPRRPARLGDGAVRGALRRDGVVPVHRAGIRHALSFGGRHPAGRLPVGEDRFLRQLRSVELRQPARPRGGRCLALLGRRGYRDPPRRHGVHAAVLSHQARHAPPGGFHGLPARRPGAAAEPARSARRPAGPRRPRADARRTRRRAPARRRVRSAAGAGARLLRPRRPVRRNPAARRGVDRRPLQDRHRSRLDAGEHRPLRRLQPAPGALAVVARRRARRDRHLRRPQ